MGVDVSFAIWAICFTCKHKHRLDNKARWVTPQWLEFRTKHAGHKVDMHFREPRGEFLDR